MRSTCLALLLLAAVVTGLGIGARDFWPPDEARYGRVVTEMLDRGELAVPHLNGEVYHDKPPAYFWVVGIVSVFTGRVDEATTRLPSAFGACLIVLLVTGFAGRAAGARVGALSGLTLLSTWFFVWKARYAQLDTLFAALIAASLLAFFAAAETGRRRLAILACLSLGLAILVKGPLALVGLLVPLIWRYVGRPPRVGSFGPLGFASCALALFGPVTIWLTWTVCTEGASYAEILIGTHTLERVRTGLAHVRPWWFYVSRLGPALLPGLLFLPVWMSPRAREFMGPSGRRLAGYALIWSTVFFVVQSTFPGKRTIYALVYFPALAILIGSATAAGVSAAVGGGAKRWTVGVLACGAAVLLLLGSLAIWSGAAAGGPGAVVESVAAIFGGEIEDGYRGLDLPSSASDRGFDSLRRSLRIMAIPALIGGLGIGISLLMRRFGRAAWLHGLAWALTLVAAASTVAPELDSKHSRRRLAERTAESVAAHPLRIFRHLDEGILFYFGRSIPEISPPAGFLRELDERDLDEGQRDLAMIAACEYELEEWMSGPARRYCLIRSKDRERLDRMREGIHYDLVLSEVVGSDRSFDLVVNRQGGESAR